MIVWRTNQSLASHDVMVTRMLRQNLSHPGGQEQMLALGNSTFIQAFQRFSEITEVREYFHSSCISFVPIGQKFMLGRI